MKNSIKLKNMAGRLGMRNQLLERRFASIASGDDPFGADRADAMRRFLVDEGIGKDERFWRLAQAFSALYPSNTDEKRWVDGVLARKKSLGF